MIDWEIERYFSGIGGADDPYLSEPPAEDRPASERAPEQGRLFEITDTTAFDPER